MKNKWMRDHRKPLIIGLIGIFVVMSYFLIPSVKSVINQITGLLASANIEALKDYILSFGVWAPLVSMLLMMFQSIVAPLPAFVITFANAWVFGWMQGAFYSWTGAMLGAILCFYISRFLGRPVAEKLVTATALKKWMAFLRNTAIIRFSFAVLCRLFPLMRLATLQD